MVDVLRERSAHDPDRLSFSFLNGSAEQTMTYGELDARARAIAATLREELSLGDRVVLLYPPGLEYVAAFYGCLYAGVVAVPAYPPDPMRAERTVPRLRRIVVDSKASVVLTDKLIHGFSPALFQLAPELADRRWIATDADALREPSEWSEELAAEADIAFIQYTSGSTGDPRGVVLTHANIMANQQMIKEAFGHDEKSRGMGWLPLYHDMGLLGFVVQPIYLGTSSTLMSPLDFLRRPTRWLEAISRCRATTSGGPNFAYELCLRKSTPEERAELDLSSWKVAFCGAEPIRPETLRRFADTFAECGFRREALYPCYGLAEATLIATGGTLGEPLSVHQLDASSLEQDRAAPARGGNREVALVGCGAPRAGRLAIVDATTMRPLTDNEVGEVWLAGPHIAAGYWDRQAETAETFQARHDGDEEVWLRTGDLGFLRQGELVVTGRLKDLIIIHGRNFYPTDIEGAAEAAHEALRPGCCAAFTIPTRDAESELCVAAEVHAGADGRYAEIIRDVQRAVSLEIGLAPRAVILLAKGIIPKTSSGKIQRGRCRADFLGGTLDVLCNSLDVARERTEDELGTLLAEAPPEEHHEILCMLVTELLAPSLQVPPESIDTDRPLEEMGLDSVMVAELVTSLTQVIHDEIDIGEAGASTVEELASRLLLLRDIQPHPPLPQPWNEQAGKDKLQWRH